MPPASHRVFSTDRHLLLVRALVMVYAVNCFSFLTADPDLWGHVKFGEELWLDRSIPYTDSHSYTAHGLPWMNHEWLTEVLFYLVYRLAGSAGLLVLKLTVGLCILQLASSLYLRKNRNSWIYLCYFVLFTHVLAPGFMVRPQLMTYLLLTLLLVCLHRFFEGRYSSLRWTPLIVLLWVNMHGGVLAGIVIYGAVVAVETIRCLFTKERHWRPLVTWFLLSCVAALVNPYGPKLWMFFCNTVFTPRDIDEWAAIPLWDTRHWQFKAMTALLLITFLFPTRKRPWQVALILLAVVYGFKHQRHSVLAAIVMTPYVPLQWAAMTSRWGRVQEWCRGVSPGFRVATQLSFVAFIVFQGGYVLQKYWASDFQIIVEPEVYPVHAVRFLGTNGIDGNIRVPFEWGEYVIWKRHRSKVSIDGRFRTVYPEEVIRRSWNFTMGSEGWREIIEQYPTDIILTRRSEHGHYLLRSDPEWEQIYEDAVAGIWIPRTDPPSSLLRKWRRSALVHRDDPPPTAFP